MSCMACILMSADVPLESLSLHQNSRKVAHCSHPLTVCVLVSASRLSDRTTMSSSRGSRTDSSSGLMANLTPTEELDNEPVFIDNVVAQQQCSRSCSTGSIDQTVVSIGCRSREEDIYEDLCYVNLRLGARVLEVSPQSCRCLHV